MSLSANVDEDGFYMTGLSETRRTMDDGDVPASDSAMREILAAMPGAMKTTSGSQNHSPVRRNPRFNPLTEEERTAARAQAADERREEAIRIKKRAVEVKRQAEARYVPPVDGPCLCMTLVLALLVSLWVADIYYEYLLAQNSGDDRHTAPQPTRAGAPVHEDI